MDIFDLEDMVVIVKKCVKEIEEHCDMLDDAGSDIKYEIDTKVYEGDFEEVAEVRKIAEKIIKITNAMDKFLEKKKEEGDCHE